MSELGHDLHALFPEQNDILHKLKLESAHYRTLADLHHKLIQEISRIEAGLEPAADDRLEDLKKQRLGVLDEVAAMIAEKKDAA